MLRSIVNTLLSFFLNSKVKLLILALVLVSLFAYHKVLVHEAITEAVAEVELNISKENFKLKERSLNAQIELQQSFDNIQKDKDAKIKNLNARVASLTRSLQERPSRPESSGVPDNSRIEETPKGATGAQLYRQDGEFLAREAARAELIKEELLGCYKSYDAAKEALDRYKKENTPKTD